MESASPLGVVYISFGSTYQAPLSASRAIISTIRSMPDVRFIWKLTEDEHRQLSSELTSLSNLHKGAAHSNSGGVSN
jgi:hypothetical protein